ncbi:MAG TPA: amidohydrolase family protein [Burkholderiaceae bacterium]|nr:amidohydrolase family protein [Burkholderiaceae bacterium]
MLFQNGSIFDGAELLPSDWALLVEGEHIAAIGPQTGFAGYAGPRTDMSGQTLLPGLIDCHAHLTLSGDLDGFGGALTRFTRAGLTLRALENAQACLRGGVTALRDCGGVDHIEIAVRDACNSGRFLGPTIRVAGRCICMTGGTNAAVARIADGPDEIVAAVREQVHAGCDCIKLMATGGVLSPGTDVDDAQYTQAELEAGVAEARRLRKPVASHAIGAAGILNAARAGVDSIEHGVFLTDEGIREMLERRVFLVPTLAAITQIVANLGSGFSPEVVAKANKVARAARQSVKRYYEAGGRIAMGADTGTPFNPHGDNARELQYMVEAGMAPADALKAATANAADLLRLSTRGHLKAGFVADLLLVDGDPTRDIERAADRTHHRAVFKAGRCVHERTDRRQPHP